MDEAIVYIDRSEIRDGASRELRTALQQLAEFVQEREPQLLAYGFHIDEEDSRLWVVAVHPNAASLELHLRIGGPEFRKVGKYIVLRAIEVFGDPGAKVTGLLHEKAQVLGGASVMVHPRTEGFDRV